MLVISEVKICFLDINHSSLYSYQGILCCQSKLASVHFRAWLVLSVTKKKNGNFLFRNFLVTL